MPSAESITEPAAASDQVAPGSDVSAPPSPELPRQGHDFRAPPSLLTPSQTRQLRLRYEEFSRSLATRLSIYLRLEVDVQVAQLQTVRFRQWTDSMAAPTHLTLFRADNVDAFLEVPPTLGLTFLDRLLGGKGSAANPARDLTQIETAVVDEIVLIILKEWCPYGLNVSEAKPAITQHENNPRFLRTLPGETTLLLVSVTVSINGTSGPIAIALPLSAVEGLLERIAPAVEPKRSPAKPGPAVMKWNPELDQVNIALTAGWAGFEISARRLAQLEVGDILPVDPNIVNQVEVRLAQVPKFIGRLGASGKARAVKLISAVTA